MGKILKKKSIIVITVSSITLSIVILSTFAGFFLYATWKENEGEELYLEKLGSVLAQTYYNKIVITDLEAKISKTYPYKEKPVLKGSIENLGNSTIKHLVIKVYFLDFRNDSIYDVEFEPLKYISKKEGVVTPFIEMLIREDEVPLGENEKAEFTYSLENCPPEIGKMIENNQLKPTFVKHRINKDSWSGKLKTKILRMRFF